MSSRTQTTKYEDDDEYSFDDLDGIDLDSIPELRATPLAVTSTPSQSRQFTGEPYDCSSLQYLVPSSLPRLTELDTHSALLLSTANKADDTTTSASKQPVLARSTTPSTEYDFEDDVDDEFLRELDALESELVSVTNQPSRPSALPNAGNPTNLTATTSQLIPQTKPLLQHHAPVLLDRKCSVSTACDEYRVAGRNSSQKRSLQDESENEYNHSDDTSVVATIAPIRATTHEDGRSQKKLKKFMEDFEDEISCPM
ncbi:hypothetical protein BDY19DRAFT_28294 [Irpex rosettiformis]|uniref:Uncharacterized protein n=1 Tax=Irpex rosettiformis TaxID=378272 RepID=A0ACB8UJQ0_9APHY|nr:hypothetical protein BDY19DRAFT_28294 [Irpex rosettiformis]